MEALIQFCLDHLNYWTVMLFMAIESSFIPFPSEAVVPPAAWKAAVSGDMNIVLVVVFATLGALMGALINYYIAVWFGRPIVYRFANSRMGHMCLIDEAKVQKAERSSSTSCASAHIYSCRSCAYGDWSFCALHNNRCRYMECDSCRIGLLYGIYPRNADRRGRDEQGEGIQ